MILLPQEYWEIRETKEKGRGIFAVKEIAIGTIIGDYIGKVLHPQNAIVDEENFYLMYYHDHAVITPDLTKDGVHLLNHSCTPNAWLSIYKGHTLAFALKHIVPGEEILIPYLLAPQDKYCKPCLHVCKCQASNCRGTMHLSEERYAAWRKLTEAQAKETKRERIKYGKDLPALSSYPKISAIYIEQVKELLKVTH